MGGKRTKNRSGLSLIETIIAAGILLAAFLLFTRLFTFGLRGVSRASLVAANVATAESYFAELESLAAQNSWSSLLGRDGSSFESDGATIDIEVLPYKSFSPSTEWERPFEALGTDRSFQDVSVQVTVTVRREGNNSSLTRIISRPRLSLASPPIELVNLPSGPMNGFANATVRARLLAADGSEIPAAFQWYVIPGTGTGSIQPSRNGREATFTNSAIGKSGAAILTGGDCQLRVRTVYFGEEIEVTSPSIGLNT